MRSLGRAPCRGLRELHREPLVELHAELPAEPLAELLAEPLVKLWQLGKLIIEPSFKLELL